jgi:hypothetical protein
MDVLNSQIKTETRTSEFIRSISLCLIAWYRVLGFSISQKSFVALDIFDNPGRERQCLVHESQEAGENRLQFNGDRLSSGIYYFKLEAGNYIDVKKCVMVK